MKRKILTLLVSGLALFAFAFGASACRKKHIHEYGEWTVAYGPTCTAAGEKRRFCDCGKYETEEIPPLGHEYTDCEKEEIVYSKEGFGFKPYRCCTREGCGYSDYILTGFKGESAASLIIPSTYNGKPVAAIAKNAFNAWYGDYGFESVVIPDSVEYIGDSAFYACENIKSVTLGNGVKIIGELAFADCSKLETLSLGNSVKAIEGYAFSQCIKLEGVDLPSSVESIGECAFVLCRSIKKITLNDGLKSIGDCAFGGCSSISSFVMPDSVTSIGWGVLMFNQGGNGWFEGGDLSAGVNELVISKSITEIPDYAFSKCNITEVKIHGKVKTIRYSAFYGCGFLQSMILPKSVTKIESYAFYGCAALNTVYYEGTEEEWKKISIGKNGNDFKDSATLYFYSETQPEQWGNFWHYENGVPAVWQQPYVDGVS